MSAGRCPRCRWSAFCVPGQRLCMACLAAEVEAPMGMRRWDAAVAQCRAHAALIDATDDVDLAVRLENSAQDELDAAYRDDQRSAREWREAYCLCRDATERFNRRALLRAAQDRQDAVRIGLAAGLARIPGLFP